MVYFTLPMILGRRAPVTAASGGFTTPLARTIVGGLNSPQTTPAIDTTGANLIIVCVSQFPTNIGVLSDSRGNTWTASLTARTLVAQAYCKLYYCANPSVGSGHTFTLTAGGFIAGGLAVQAWAGANATPFDVENGNTAAGVTIQPGSVTPNQNNSLIVSGIATGAGGGFAIDNGFVITDSVNFSGGATDGISFAYLVQPTAAAMNPTWSNGSQYAATIAVFKP